MIDDTGVEVHVGVQLALDEVLIVKGDSLQLESDVEFRIPPGNTEELAPMILAWRNRSAFMCRRYLKSDDDVPIAAPGIVSKLLDRIPGRYALDTPLFRRDVFVARYDKRLGVRNHCTEDRAHMLSHNVAA